MTQRRPTNSGRPLRHRGSARARRRALSVMDHLPQPLRRALHEALFDWDPRWVRAELDKRLRAARRPDDLRHTWATWRYAIEPDLLRLQQAGNWSSVSQVQVYAHILPTAYRDQAEAWFAGTVGAESVQPDTPSAASA